jgi:hypothetical protein
MQTVPKPRANPVWKILAKRAYAMWLKLHGKPNINQIRPFLWLGAAYSQSQFAALYQQGIRAVADMRAENALPPFISTYPELHFRRFPVVDRKAHSQEELLQIVLWVLEQTKRHCHTLVHCQHGIGRAPLVLACVLLTEGLQPAEAISELECLRWQVRMNRIQLGALREFSNTWMRFLNNKALYSKPAQFA